MKVRSTHKILAFYSSGVGDPKQALHAARAAGAHSAELFAPGQGDSASRDGQLRLDDESLIAIAVSGAPAGVDRILKALESSGSPAIFVLHPDLPAAPPGGGSVFARMREYEIAFDEARRDLVAATSLGRALTASAEWILDNSYLVRTQIFEIRRHLPRNFPKSPSGNGYAPALELARALVAETDRGLTGANITSHLEEFQKTSPLSTASLWFFPLFLGLALVEDLARLASAVNAAQQLREDAYLWANRLASAARIGPGDVARTMGLLEKEPIALQPYFITSLAEQLQDEEGALAPLRAWIQDHFDSPMNDLVRAEHTQEAAQCVSVANAFGSLRLLSRIDFAKIFETVSLVERELASDPSGVYSRSDFATRDECRRVVERISRNSDLLEVEVARRAVALARDASDPRARHVAYFLLTGAVRELEAATHTRVPIRVRLVRALRRNATGAYLGGLACLTAAFLMLALMLAWDGSVHRVATLAILGLLALFPLSELAQRIVHVLVIALLPPCALAKLDFSESGIPPEDATLVVVPMLLSGAGVVRREVEKLEVRYLANREANLFFALFSDFIDAAHETTSDDEELLRTARMGIRELNARYPGGRFLLFHRPRTWSESELCWIGRERKRGKLGELNAFLLGGGAKDILLEGALPLAVRYAIALDADTQLPPGTARKMIETMAHPLNRVEIDPATHTRRRGFSIIQPRVSVSLPNATATRFTRIFADTTGTDPYCKSVSDAQQDLFGEGIFHGKAIYDVRAFHETVGNRFPAETLLSHDLIEGSFAGVALASDIELFENLPRDYVSYCKRLHRWIRGDWQIAPWIWPSVPSASGAKEANSLSLIGRFRILDNLRRSLVPAASLLLLLFGWLASPAPGVWSLVIGATIAILALAPLLDRVARRIQGQVQGWTGAADELVRSLVMLAFLPHQAWVSIDAMVRVKYRTWWSKHHLLEWQTAEASGADAHRYAGTTMRQMLGIAGLSVLLMFVLASRHALSHTFFFLVAWAASPALIRWLDGSTPLFRKEKDDARFLRRTARRTWRYFDDLVNQESNWLPPDNSQLALRIEVAQRTSPTNIGLWLASALAATDLGYLTADEFLDRCSKTMETLRALELYEGHLLNWYDTKTRLPLLPRYVSTVDSGNLLASLWVLERGIAEVLHAPILDRRALIGVADTLGILLEGWGRDPSIAMPLRAVRRMLHGKADGYEAIGRLRMILIPVQQLAAARRWQEERAERSYWVTRLAHDLGQWIATIDRYLSWMETLSTAPDSFLSALSADLVKLRRRALRAAPSLTTLAEGRSVPVETILAWRGTPDLRPDVAQWLDQLASEYSRAKANAAEEVRKMRALSGAASEFANATNMGLLYDKNRRLFGVGYAVGGPLEFHSYYDLLASECRLASLVAIAKGDVPVEHWQAMARPLASSPGGRTLLSWSGTMFEYLMPLLFARSFTNSLLDHACKDAVDRQIAYGNEKGVAWGLSESAYSAIDANRTYQYKAFGVPGLALKPGLPDDLVISPYASMLALMVRPAPAIANLRRLQRLEMEGPMGFYESIDFSRENRRDGKRGVTTFAYMAHHQGMSLIALDNVLHRDIMQERFHADVRIRAVVSLLFERMPIAKLPADEVQQKLAPVRAVVVEDPAERTWKEDTPVPRAHLQGNGRYCLMITAAGGGYSRSKQFDVTRWRSDTTLDAWGSFVYIRDLRSDAVWSATYHPVGGRLGTSSASFSADRAEFRRAVLGIETVLDVTVAAEDEVELRRLTISNRTLRTRQLELTSYAELALAPHAADAAHPAFAKMFVETEALGDDVLIAHRRPRGPEDAPVWAAHCILGAVGGIQHETDRAIFLGRGNGVATPDALRTELSGSTGAVLDPIFSLRSSIALEARDRVEITFVTSIADSREALLALIEKYRRPEAAARAFEMAWTRAQLEFRYLGIGPSTAHRFQELASHLLYPNARLRPPSERLVQNRLGQSKLWAYGISGDLPMLVATIADIRQLPLIRELLLAHTYWRLRGFHCDLIILNQEMSSYDRPLEAQLQRQIEAHALEAALDKPGGVFLRDWNNIAEEHRTLLLAAASVVLSGQRGSLKQQLATIGELPPPPVFLPSGNTGEQPSRPLPFLELPYFNGQGGFTSGGGEYAIYLKPGDETPSPWANVMANPSFGTLVSESGLGCTWSGNSQSNRLTPWHNDPVTNPPSEAIYLRDDESGAIWSPTPLPVREKDAYRARHGQGYTVFEHNSHSIGQELTVFVPGVDPVKVCRLRLRNDSGRPRRLTITYYAEWVLGSTREDQQKNVQTTHDETSGAVMATQTWSGAFTGNVAFAASSPRAASYAGDRAQFLGRNNIAGKPFALGRTRLDNRTGAGLDPAAALQIPLTLDAGHESEVVFLLGETSSAGAMRELIERYRSPRQVEDAFQATHQTWDRRLGRMRVHTPLLSTDFLLNRWLPYQVLSCRFWGRTAMQQSSGAFGYRDQLQDSLAFLYIAPELTRAHILAAAARQFEEGDVQHWWHAETGLGVRTRCCDDMVWLAFVTAHYVAVTGDTGILDEAVPFLEAPPLGEQEQERMFVPEISSQPAPLLEHCRRALDRAWKLGPHELPLIGTGDWNDGMNRVGVKGQGESVWLGWFLCAVFDAFAPLIERRDAALAALWRDQSKEMAGNIERTSWDGEWYLRAFFDNGAPLGSHANEEAKIDSLTQSWAVLSGVAERDRARQAMESADRLLVKDRDRLVLLFTPPFDHSEPHPGYIMGYPRGVRENGGQYTHGSLWLAAAWARLGDGNAAVRLLTMMNPVESSRTPESAAHFRGEPYVSPADVSASEGRAGRAGWTWYTGSAGWMYRIWIEEVLGFQLRGGTLTIAPAIPDDWDGFEITYRHGSSEYEIVVRRDAGGAAGSPIQLVDDGATHKIEVRIPPANRASADASEENAVATVL